MSIEVKRTPIFSNPDLEAEHSALHTMACIIAQKWMLDLEHKDCSFSYDGLKWFYEDEMGNEYFAPCMRRECACFHVDCGEAYCSRNGAYMYLGELEADDGPNRCCDARGHYDTCAGNKMEERNE